MLFCCCTTVQTTPWAWPLAETELKPPGMPSWDGRTVATWAGVELTAPVPTL